MSQEPSPAPSSTPIADILRRMAELPGLGLPPERYDAAAAAALGMRSAAEALLSDPLGDTVPADIFDPRWVTE